MACHGDPLPLSEPGAPITEADDDALVHFSPTATVDREWLESGLLGAFISRDLGALLAGDYLASFGLDRCCEELAAVTALGREHDVSFELSGLVEQMYQRALSRYGPADGELLAVAPLEEAAGVRLRHGLP